MPQFTPEQAQEVLAAEQTMQARQKKAAMDAQDQALRMVCVDKAIAALPHMQSAVFGTEEFATRNRDHTASNIARSIYEFVTGKSDT